MSVHQSTLLTFR